MTGTASPNRRRSVTAVTAFLTLLGVVILAVRCSHARPGDGPVRFAPVAGFGIVFFVLPLAVLAGRAMNSHPASRPFIFVTVTIASAVIATRRPGNLVALWYVAVAIPTAATLALVGSALGLRRLRRRD